MGDHDDDLQKRIYFAVSVIIAITIDSLFLLVYFSLQALASLVINAVSLSLVEEAIKQLFQISFAIITAIPVILFLARDIKAIFDQLFEADGDPEE